MSQTFWNITTEQGTLQSRTQRNGHLFVSVRASMAGETYATGWLISETNIQNITDN